MKPKILILFIYLYMVEAQQNLDQIECPFPEGTPADIEESCRLYSACIWDTSSSTCHMDDNALVGYTVSSETVDTERGFMVNLQKFDAGRTMFNGDIMELVFEVINHEDYHLQIKIYDPATPRYEVPIPLNLPDSPGTDPLYSVSVSEYGSSFSFSVNRISTGKTILNSLGPLSFEDQFIQLTTSLASTYFYGLGQASHETFRRAFNTRLTTPIFARDQTLSKNEVNENAVHPYYVNVEDDDGNTHSVLFYNSNAMEFSSFTLTDGSPALTIRTIGGIIDLHLFLGPTPESVNVQYSLAIGTAAIPPYWALGFHLSQYTSALHHTTEARDRMKDAGIPMDSQLIDIDYMHRNQDFTYDKDYYKDLPDYIEELHADGVRLSIALLTVIDLDNQPIYSNGVDNDAYVKWMDSSLIPDDQIPGSYEYMVGYNDQPNKTVYPDFFSPQTRDWWTSECQLFHDVIQYDGIWITANTPSNIGTNMNEPPNHPWDQPNWSLKCPNNTLDDPPFPTKASYIEDNLSKRISDGTLCLSGLHSDGNNSYLHYDVHSLYGHSSVYAMKQTLEEIFPGKRPFIVTTSTFPGSGSQVAGDLGVNFSTWESMEQSIIDILNFNQFIFPFIGADVCGYFGVPSEELCARWMQLGSFYPYCRDHNDLNGSNQDPSNPDWPLVNSVSREYLLLRYKYLPYLYLLFQQAHVYGGTVARPLFNVFPTDIYARDVQDQFFWGDGIMIAPVLKESNTSREIYFPKAMWFEIMNGTVMTSGSRPELLDVEAPMEVMPVYVKGGIILPFQEPNVTTALSRNNSFGLTVALDEAMTASGQIFWDDGESFYSEEDSFLASLEFINNTLSETIHRGEDIMLGLNLTIVQFYGYMIEPLTVIVNGERVSDFLWDYHVETKVLFVNVDNPMSEPIEVVVIPS